MRLKLRHKFKLQCKEEDFAMRLSTSKEIILLWTGMYLLSPKIYGQPTQLMWEIDFLMITVENFEVSIFILCSNRKIL
jgi:hypothetical protein